MHFWISKKKKSKSVLTALKNAILCGSVFSKVLHLYEWKSSL
jgi:hypothetical protein